MNEYHQLNQAIINAHVRRMLDEMTYRERVALARRVLRGDDIHEDCW